MLPKHLNATISLPLAEQMIREGAWWDYVDEISSWIVGPLVRAFPRSMGQSWTQWNTDSFMWIRRSSILCQLSAGTATDQARLFRYCLACAHETEFFIRKAIGWALRQYARVAPAAVLSFVRTNAASLSPLSKREALKHLGGLDALSTQRTQPAAKRVRRTRVGRAAAAVDSDNDAETEVDLSSDSS